jgi:hypothetical protein
MANGCRELDRDQADRGMLEHDPEKWEPVFGKDHAQTRIQSVMAIQLEVIAL